MVSKSLRFISFAAISFLIIGLTSQLAVAQGFPNGETGGAGGVGGFDPGAGRDTAPVDPGAIDPGIGGNVPVDPGTTGNNVGDTGGTGGGGGSLTDGTDENFFDNLESVIDVDERRRAFVGPTSSTIGAGVATDAEPLGYVGPTGEDLLDGAFSPPASRVTSGRSEIQNTQGFTVERRSVRSFLRPAFQFRPVEGNFISTRFQNRLQQLPNTRNFGQGVQVSVQNQTALVSGSVDSQEEAFQIIGQLRLEPGVYKIDNRLTLRNSGSR